MQHIKNILTEVLTTILERAISVKYGEGIKIKKYDSNWITFTTSDGKEITLSIEEVLKEQITN